MTGKALKGWGKMIRLNKELNKKLSLADTRQKIFKELAKHYIEHKEVIVSAWFAKYGFEPGKAILVNDSSLGEYIREATEEEKVRMSMTEHDVLKEAIQTVLKYAKKHGVDIFFSAPLSYLYEQENGK